MANSWYPSSATTSIDTSKVSLGFEYTWGTPNETKRTIPCKVSFVSHEIYYYLQVTNQIKTDVTNTTTTLGYQIIFKINDKKVVYSGNFVESSTNGNDADHVRLLYSTTVDIPFDDNGNAVLKLKCCPFFLHWQDIQGRGYPVIYSEANTSIDCPKTITPNKISKVKINSGDINLTLCPNSITLKANNVTVNSGAKVSITPTVKFNNYVTKKKTASITPANAKGSLAWTTSNSTVVSINPVNSNYTVITGKTVGTSIVVCKANSGVSDSITVTITKNNAISWTTSDSKLMTISNNIVTTNSSMNGSAVITAKAKANSVTTSKIRINCHLKPNGINVTANKTSAYSGDTVLITSKVLPHTTITNTTVSTKYDKISSFSATSGKLSTTGVSDSVHQRKLTLPVVDKTTTITVYANITTPSLSGNVAIKVLPRNLVAYPTDITIIKNSYENVTITTVPSNTNYNLSTYNSKICSITKSGNKLTIKGLDLGTTTTKVTSAIDSSLTADVKINVVDAFGEPNIVYPNTNEVYYDLYGKFPKIILKLPEIKHITLLDDIRVEYKGVNSNGNVLKQKYINLKNNSDCYSIAYGSSYTEPNLVIKQAINSSKIPYCVISSNSIDFSDCAAVYVKVIYESKINELTGKAYAPNTSKSIQFRHAEKPALPKVGSYFKLSDLNVFINTLKTVSTPFAYIRQCSLSDYINHFTKFGVSSEPIIVQPFFDFLTVTNKFLTDLHDMAYCSDYIINLPKHIAPNLIRLPYYNLTTAVNSNLPIIENAVDNYPIMVDDSKSTIANTTTHNLFKDSIFYANYTVSPLKEFNNALDNL